MSTVKQKRAYRFVSTVRPEKATDCRVRRGVLDRRLHVNGRLKENVKVKGEGEGEEWYKGGTGKEVTRSVWRSRRSQEREREEREGEGGSRY